MGFFDKLRLGIDFDEIKSVVILEQTELIRNQRKRGLGYGATLGDSRVFVTNESVPAGTEMTFSVRYRNGKQDIVKARAGTTLCDRLLQLALDPPSARKKQSQTGLNSVEQFFQKHVSPSSSGASQSNADTNGSCVAGRPPVSLGKNELPSGRYVIGKDIPPGKYDFTWVWGSGILRKFPQGSDDPTYVSSITFVKQCFHVECVSGEVLELTDNMIVRIAKSKPISLDL